jgi:hypothetical protein
LHSSQINLPIEIGLLNGKNTTSVDIRPWRNWDGAPTPPPDGERN